MTKFQHIFTRYSSYVPIETKINTRFKIRLGRIQQDTLTHTSANLYASAGNNHHAPSQHSTHISPFTIRATSSSHMDARILHIQHQIKTHAPHTHRNQQTVSTTPFHTHTDRFETLFSTHHAYMYHTPPPPTHTHKHDRYALHSSASYSLANHLTATPRVQNTHRHLRKDTIALSASSHSYNAFADFSHEMLWHC